MYLIYSLLLFLAFVLLFPYFTFQALLRNKYRANFWQRLGLVPGELAGDSRPTIWLHCVSVGEALAAQPLVQELRRRLTDWRIVVSTTTITGQKIARERFAGLDGIFYFPFDWQLCARRSLKRIAPQMVIIMETELWPNFLRETRKQKIPVIVANGRISPKSFRRYFRVRSLIKRVLQNVTLFCMQSKEDASRIATLGECQDKIVVTGNLKYDVGPGQQERYDAVAEHLNGLLALSGTRQLIVAGSTAAGEEEMLLDSLRAIRKHPSLSQVRLLIAPRHPERFEEVARIIKRSGFSLARRSQLESNSSDADVILLDSIGELAAVYRFAGVVFVGGSLAPKGGHNILEPAIYGKPIIVGPYTDNFRQIISDFANQQAAVQLPLTTADELGKLLTERLIELLSSDAGQMIGERARAVIDRNRGAAARTVDEIVKIIEVNRRRGD